MPGAIEDALKLTVIPAGAPEAESATFELKPSEVCTLTRAVPLEPFPIAPKVGLTDKVNDEDGTPVDCPTSAPIRAGAGLPQPVTRS